MYKCCDKTQRRWSPKQNKTRKKNKETAEWSQTVSRSLSFLEQLNASYLQSRLVESTDKSVLHSCLCFLMCIRVCFPFWTPLWSFPRFFPSNKLNTLWWNGWKWKIRRQFGGWVFMKKKNEETCLESKIRGTFKNKN